VAAAQARRQPQGFRRRSRGGGCRTLRLWASAFGLLGLSALASALGALGFRRLSHSCDSR
jgi:hypothetical protein